MKLLVSPTVVVAYPLRTLLRAVLLAVLASTADAAVAQAQQPLQVISTASKAARQHPQMAQMEFEDSFLNRSGSGNVDISRFSQGNPVAPGTYRVDVVVNGGFAARTDVMFRALNPGDNAVACFTRELLDLSNVDMSRLAPEAEAALAAKDNSCLQLQDLVPDAFVTYNSPELQLNVSVPQIALSRSARGYINPEFWDDGVTAGILNYNFNSYRSSSSTGGSGGSGFTSSYLGLNGGVNLGPWRLRNSGSFSKSSNGPLHYNNISTYVQRAIVPWQSQLIVGDAYTDGSLFDSFGFRGVQLASDDRMLPDSQRGYAPVVRGIARTNAKVSIRQNGALLYETTVAPGPFEINDLYPTGYGGALDVEVTEADGSRNVFSVPYAAINRLLRPGRTRYSATIGQTRNSLSQAKTDVVTGTVEHGFSNDFTAYTGAILSRNYQAVLAGSAFNTPIGAVGADVTQSHASFDGAGTGLSRNGQSARITYNKLLLDTQTNFALAAYRFSSSGYLSLNDALQTQSQIARGFSVDSFDRRRSQLQVIMSQPFAPGYGTLSVSGSAQNYWNREGSTTQFQLGYGNNFRGVSYSASVVRQKDAFSGQTNTQYLASVSLPFGSGMQAPQFNANVTTDRRNGSNQQASVSGVAGEQNQLSYSVGGSRSNGGANFNSSVSYQAPYASLNASYGRGNGFQQLGAGASGAVVVHPGGVTLAQSTGDTVAVVEAVDAGGAQLSNVSGGRLDSRGYGVVPYLQAYRSNEVSIDPKGLSTDLELTNTSQQAVPTAGAVVMVKFKTSTARSVVIDASRPDGQEIPFGADVQDDAGNSLGTAGPGGRLFLRGVDDTGLLTIKWGKGTNEQCQLAYQLRPRDPKAKGSVLEHIESRCVAPGMAKATPTNPGAQS